MDATAKAFAALGHAGRLRIVEMLLEAGAGGMSAGTIVTRLGARQNSVSSQLKVLAEAGVVTTERRGRQILYRIDGETMAAMETVLRR